MGIISFLLRRLQQCCPGLGWLLWMLFSIIRDDLFNIAILWNNGLKNRDHILAKNWVLETFKYQPHTEIDTFILQINRITPILCLGLNGTFIVIAGTFYCDLATTWYGIQFSTWFISTQYRVSFALRHILGIPGWPLSYDSIHYSHKFGCNKQPTQISNAAILNAEIMSLDLTPWGLGPPLCSTRASLEANSWINNCIVASYFCSTHIIDICIGSCIGVIHL